MAKWTNLETKQVFNEMTDGIRWILLNTNGIISKDEYGNNYLNDEIVADVARRTGMDKYRIKKTFENDIEKGITDIDKETGLRMSDLKSRKLHDLKKKSEVIENKNLQVEDTSVNRNKENQMTKAQNIILYGPPGTGKTWELINKWIPEYCTKNQTKKEAHHVAIQEFVSSATWWEVILYAMLDLGGKDISVSELIAHNVLQMKASLSSCKNVRATLWGNLQMHAQIDSKTVNYTQRQSPAIFNKNNDSTWFLVDNWKMEAPDVGETIDFLLNETEHLNQEIKRYEFITFHQSYSYEEFIEGLRPERNDDGQISYEVKPGVFQRICNRARLDPQNRYAIFIDEINRGNISKIFGELITLIESDKRVQYDNKGQPDVNNHGVEVTLPYSGKTFGVPQNLDIIGTMNTADRSIALLDIALRRRFEFRELMPDVNVIKGSDGNGTIENGSVDLQRLLAALNNRIRLLAGRDLQLGHAFFCKVNTLSDLHKCFANTIIPLLQEYFYGHWERIQLVLGERPEQLQDEHKNRRNEICFILCETLREADILGFDHDDLDDKDDYLVNPDLYNEEMSIEAFTKIYQVKNAQ